jgi:hypothetical protein
MEKKEVSEKEAFGPWGKEVEGYRENRLVGAITPKWIEEFVWVCQSRGLYYG